MVSPNTAMISLILQLKIDSSTVPPVVRTYRMFKHLDSLQTDQVKDTMFLVEHEPDDVVIREGTLQ